MTKMSRKQKLERLRCPMARGEELKAPARMSRVDLIDELGYVKADVSELTKRESELKAEIVRRKIKTADGNAFRVAVTEAIKRTLDVEAVIKKLGERWVDRHRKETPYVQVSVNARTRS